MSARPSWHLLALELATVACLFAALRADLLGPRDFVWALGLLAAARYGVATGRGRPPTGEPPPSTPSTRQRGDTAAGRGSDDDRPDPGAYRGPIAVAWTLALTVALSL